MSLNRFIAGLFFLFGIIMQSNATHIIGGDMDIRHIGGNRFELNLALFYDGVGGNDVVEDSIIVSSFSISNNQKIEDFDMIRSGPYENADLSNSICNDGLNIRIYRYQGIIFLEPGIYNSSNGYYFSWQRCCRSGLISNISGAGTSGFVFYLEAPSTDFYPQNSSPAFNYLNADYYCVGENTVIDFSAYDPDGDELQYSLIQPIAGFSRSDDNVITGMPGPYPPVNGYFPVPSQNQFQIDQNGRISFTPSQRGVFALAVKCEEYRNNQKIGEVIRDLSIVVRECENNEAPEIEFYPYLQSAQYNTGDTIFIRNRDELCHGINIRDADKNSDEGEIHIIDVQGIDYSGPIPSIAKSENPNFEWEACFSNCENPEQNFFKLRYIVRDDHCPVPALDTIVVDYFIIESEDSPPVISTDYISDVHPIGEEVIFNISVSDEDSSGIIISMFGEGFVPAEREMNFAYSLSSCCTADGQFTWTPECDNLSNIDSYKLSFLATGNNCGNIGKDSLEVELFVENSDEILLQNLWLPNVLTPNGDGKNDVLRFPKAENVTCLAEKFNSIIIYNRWGREVFKSSEISFEWSAENLSAGQYFYQLKIDDYSLKGFLHVLK